LTPIRRFASALPPEDDQEHQDDVDERRDIYFVLDSRSFTRVSERPRSSASFVTPRVRDAPWSGLQARRSA